jgi:hypothetical protein
VLSSEALDIPGNFLETPDYPKTLEKCPEYPELLNLMVVGHTPRVLMQGRKKTDSY